MDKDKNKVKYVLFQPEAVGWDKGLDGAIKDAKHFGVPLAVKSQQHQEDVMLRKEFLDIEVIVID